MSNQLTIWKYTLPIKDEFMIEMPSNAKVLTIQSQNGEGCMWVLVDPDASTETRTFKTIGTGHSVDLVEFGAIGLTAYRGTYQTEGLVWHIFEKVD